MKIRSKRIVDTNKQSSKSHIVACLESILIQSDLQEVIIHYRVKNDSNSTILTDSFYLSHQELNQVWMESKKYIESSFHKRDFTVKLKLEYYGIFMYLISRQFNINIDDLEVIDTEDFSY